MDKPIFCTLTESQFSERRNTLLASLARGVVSVTAIPSGLAYDFRYSPETSSEVQRIVELEQECCGFLTFRVEQTDERIRLEITGPETAIPFIKDIWGDNSQ